jgi:integrase
MTEIARHIAADLLERAAELGSTDPDHYLFPGIEFVKTPTGRHRVPNSEIPQRSFDNAWQTLRRLAGVDTTLRMHDLRHQVASDLAEAGVPSSVGMRLMGWSSSDMRRRYEHIQDSALRQGMESMTAYRDMQRPEAPRKPVRGTVISFPCAKAV